jgi:mannosyltransferase OCH1-like enzyme
MNYNIPKVIYQTWYIKEFPENIQNSINHMMNVNVGYKHELYDDNDMLSFIEKNFDSTILDCYNSLRVGAAKADLWRYLILYNNGGIYLDVDSVIYGKLDNLLLDDDCSIISRENNFNKFVQWCLMFTPKHPILKTCIDSCVDNIRNKRYNDILKLTGPVVYSDAIRKHFQDHNIYSRTDEDINSNKTKTKTRIHSYDYGGYAFFEHPNKSELYDNKPHWTSETNIHNEK